VRARRKQLPPLVVIQEAGLEGFWIHRALTENGIEHLLPRARDSEVTSHVVRHNSKETKIAQRSVRIEVSVSVLSALLSMVASNW